MSMMPTGPLPFSRPGASSTVEIAEARSGSSAAPTAGFLAIGLEALTTPRKARIGHEILVGVDDRIALARHDPHRAAVRQLAPALLVVGEIGHHDLPENLLMHCRIEDRDNRFDSPVEVAGHQVG